MADSRMSNSHNRQQMILLTLKITAFVMLIVAIVVWFVSMVQIDNAPIQSCTPIPNQQDVFQVNDTWWRVDNSYQDPIFSQLNDQDEWVTVDEFPFGLPGETQLIQQVVTYEIDGIYHLDYDDQEYYWNQTKGDWRQK